MSKLFRLACLCIFFVMLSGCFTHKHTIGSGFHTGQKDVYRQWYVLWGTIPLGSEKDGGQIAGTTNCTITTKFTGMDCLINMFTGVVTIHRRTVIVEK